MKNRLQFNRHYAEFQSREDALTALRARITDPGFIPLIGEPIVFRYKDENGNLQVILAIGKKAGSNLDERDYHVIDTADLDEKIAAEVAAREALDAETIKRIIFDGVENTFEDNVATLSVSASSIPIGPYEEYDGRANTPHPIHDDYSVLEAVKQVDTNFISFLDDTNAKIDGIHIVKVTSGLDANVREAYDLVNLSGYPQPNSERILIYKDSSLYNVYLGHVDDRLDDYTSPVVTPGTGDTALCFIYLKADSTYQLVAINVEDFLQENEFEDGFVVDNHVVKVKIDQLSEPFLTVSTDGVKLAGVQDAIDAAQQAEEDRAVSAETAIQAELDATQTGAGLDTDGSYIHDHTANYVDTATSLANADHLLDAALKAESDRAISAETAEAARATAAEGVLQENIDAEETRATAAETTLQNNIDAEESRATAAEGTLQGNIDTEEARATAAEASISGAVDTLSAATVSEIARATAAEASISGAVNTLSAATISEVARLDAAIASGNTNVDALSGAVVSEIARAENAEQAIQNELDATQTGAGLAADGSYVHDHPTTYIGVATSLANADHLLDVALKAESDRAIAAEEALQDNIDIEANRASAAEGSIGTALGEEELRAQSAEATLQSNIDDEEARAIAAESGLSQAISAETTRAQGAESTLDSKVSALSAGTESKLNSLDGKIDAETQRAEVAEDAIDNKVDALSGVTASFSSATVSEIARIDATITGNKVKSTGNTIVVTEYGNGTNLEAHIDGETILSDNGELKTGLKFISLPVGELEANVREAFKLADAQGNPVDNTTIKIYKSSSLVSLELVNVGGTDYIRVTYINNSGATQTMDLNIQQLVFETEFKDGLTVNANHEVRVEIDPTSDAYLTVSSNGVKLSGIQNAIDASVATETTRATGAESALRTDATTSAATLQGAINAEETRATAAENSISGNVNTLSGATVSGLQYISGVTDNIINACGLNTGSQGGYIPHSDTHFIGGARSLDQADVLLDQAIWALSGAAGGDITGLVSDVRNLSAETVGIDTRVAALESASTETSGLTELSAATVDIDGRLTAVEAAVIDNSGVTKLSAATIDLSAGTVSEFSEVYSDITGVRVNVDTLSGATVGVNDNVTNLSAATVSLKSKVNELSGATITLRANTNSISGATVTLSGNVTDLSAATVTLSSATSTLSAGVDKLSAFTEYLSARTLGVLTVNLNGTEQGKYCPSASTTVEVEVTGADVPLTGYEIATGSTLEELIVESADTANEAFGKLQKQIYDNEQVIAQAFNDVNDRIVELSGKSMDASDYYTKNEVDSKLQKQFSTASSVSNLTLDKYLTVATITGSSSAATLSIAQSNGGWNIADGEVMEAHVIIKNNTSAPSLTVTLPTEQSDNRVKVVGNKQLIIPHNSLGEVTALITRSGNNYTIYLSTSAQESLGEEYINATFTNNPVGASVTSNTFTLNCQNINLSTLGYDAGGSVGITSCDLATSSVTFAENTEYSDREIILSLTGTSTLGNPVTGTAQFTQSQKVVTPSLSIAYTGAGESAAAGSTAAFTLTKNYINVITGYAVNNGASVANTGQTGLTVQFPANQTESTKQYTVSVSGTDVYGATKTASTVFNQAADTYTLSITPASDTVGATSVDYQNFIVSSTNVSNSGLTYAGFITGASRTGNAINVLYTQNTGSTSRNGTVTISGRTVGGRTVSATGTLTQNSAAATSLSITYTGGTITSHPGSTSAFTVVANNVTVTGYDVTAPASANSWGSTVMVQFPANPEETDVIYTVSVLGQDEFGRTVSDSCDIVQAADTYAFSVTPGVQTVAWDATQTTFTVAATNVSNIGYYSTTSENINSCTKNGDVFTASISANQGANPKTIKFVASGLTLAGRTVYATGTTSQNGKPEPGELYVVQGEESVGYESGYTSFDVIWNNLKVGEQITFATTYVSSCDPSAITIDAQNVTGSETVYVYYTENTGSTSRYITFSASSIDQTNTPVSDANYCEQEPLLGSISVTPDGTVIDGRAQNVNFVVTWSNLAPNSTIDFSKSTAITSTVPSINVGQNTSSSVTLNVSVSMNNQGQQRNVSLDATGTDVQSMPVGDSGYYVQSAIESITIDVQGKVTSPNGGTCTATVVSWSGLRDSVGGYGTIDLAGTNCTVSPAYVTVTGQSGSVTCQNTPTVARNSGTSSRTVSVTGTWSRKTAVTDTESWTQTAQTYNYTFYHYGVLGDDSSCYGAGYQVSDGDDTITFNNGFASINCSLSGTHGMHEFEDDCTIVMDGTSRTAETYTSSSSAVNLFHGMIEFNGATQSLPDCTGGGGYGGVKWVLKLRVYDHGHRGDNSYLRGDAYAEYVGSSSSSLTPGESEPLTGTVTPGSYDVEVVLVRDQDNV